MAIFTPAAPARASAWTCLSGSQPLPLIKPPRKILVVRGGAIGDFILTLPVLAALRRNFPESSLHILGYPAIASLAVAGGLAESVTAIESPMFSGFFVDGGARPAAAAEFFAGFDLIISFAYDPDRVFQHNVARCTKAACIGGPHRPRESDDLHAAEALLRPLEILGMQGVDSRPRLRMPRNGNPAPGTWLAAHPGSGGKLKNWPEAKWAALLELIVNQTEFRLLLIGGEAEEGRCARLASRLPEARVRMAQNLPLPELARLMQDCDAFIGHDSGITHLAAALDLPGLALWGRSNASVWRPISEKFQLLRHPGGLENAPVEIVLRAVLKLLQRD